MLTQIKDLADQYFADMVLIRRTLHRRPELAFEEHETARLVHDTLQPLGLDISTGVARTGVVATLKGGQHGPTISLRADMDALPILEENTFDFASEKPGVMHACGHDAHTASLLGAAMILSRIREHVHGSIRFLFQPSEEKIPGGAPVMIKDGALDTLHETPAPQAIFGQHVQPNLPVGTIGIRSGAFMASADELFITIEGQGGHAAMPHLLSADPVLVASHLVIALQSVISRNCPPHVPSVLSFGRMVADGVTNVIPDRVRLEGTFRAMDEAWRFEAHDRIRRVVEHTVEAFGATCSLEVRVGYPFLQNDEDLARHVRESAVEYVGKENTIDVDLWMAAEDFAYYTHHMPGVFYMLGIRNEAAGIIHGLHTPRFTVDEEALRLGPGFMAYLAWKQGVMA